MSSRLHRDAEDRAGCKSKYYLGVREMLKEFVEKNIINLTKSSKRLGKMQSE